jgi:hypothetical protein
MKADSKDSNRSLYTCTRISFDCYKYYYGTILSSTSELFSIGLEFHLNDGAKGWGGFGQLFWRRIVPFVYLFNDRRVSDKEKMNLCKTYTERL